MLAACTGIPLSLFLPFRHVNWFMSSHPPPHPPPDMIKPRAVSFVSLVALKRKMLGARFTVR